MYPANGKTALEYAALRDGLTWTKEPENPVLALDHAEIHRPSVMRQDGMRYPSAVQNHQNAGAASMPRWTAPDGIARRNERLVMTCTEDREGGPSDMAVIVDHDRTSRMPHTGRDEPDGPQFGYARSPDGIAWIRYGRHPPISGFYDGDPFQVKICGWYYLRFGDASAGSLRIVCRRIRDMTHSGVDLPPVSRLSID